MHLKSTKKLAFKAVKIANDFTSETLTSYSGLTVVNDYVEHLGLFDLLEKHFFTPIKNATKLLNVQLFSAIVFANLCGVHRLSNIALFMKDTLV
ncbi:MAG: hypothetical protein LBM67_05040, partial [Lentimicrobiaceae bacterium]|nr:hypothetical protein [Lentimicrobiaceae bacterium]